MGCFLVFHKLSFNPGLDAPVMEYVVELIVWTLEENQIIVFRVVITQG